MHKCGTSMNFNGSLRHNEDKLNSKKQHLKQQGMGLTLFIKGIIFFFLIFSSSPKILNRNQNTRPACAVFLYLIQSEFQTPGEHVVVTAYLIATV